MGTTIQHVQGGGEVDLSTLTIALQAPASLVKIGKVMSSLFARGNRIDLKQVWLIREKMLILEQGGLWASAVAMQEAAAAPWQMACGPRIC